MLPDEMLNEQKNLIPGIEAGFLPFRNMLYAAGTYYIHQIFEKLYMLSTQKLSAKQPVSWRCNVGMSHQNVGHQSDDIMRKCSGVLECEKRYWLTCIGESVLSLEHNRDLYFFRFMS